jgi:hypothetical protein
MAGIEDLSPDDRRALAAGQKLLKANPDIVHRAKKLLKEADPTLRFPELEIEERVESHVKANDKKVEELEQELIKERVTRRQSERNAEIASKGFKVADIEKIIVDRKCSYETAMHIAQLEQQTAEPTAGDVRHGGNAPHSPIELRPAADWRKLQGNDLRRKSAEVAGQMIDEFTRARRAAR